ncbi:ribonuclease HII [Candidatus Woesearchaeota archaeon CG1_02_57_44]|nr:MAG: ribonuclease HII [Candidatus Woesearchaeota archaeon CG1_02_57_44]
MRILGIDEAGRGPVIGPLVICGCVIDQKDEPALKAAHVKDSKLLSPAQRQRARASIEQLAKSIVVVIIKPGEIDASSAAGVNLNQLEALKAAEIIGKSKADQHIMDCPSNNILGFHGFMSAMVKEPGKLLLEHQADKRHIAVAAASIIAKTTRDAAIETIKAEIGIDFGSGYPSDPKTVAFLNKYHTEYEHLFRKSWATYKNAIEGKQASLGDF